MQYAKRGLLNSGWGSNKKHLKSDIFQQVHICISWKYLRNAKRGSAEHIAPRVEFYFYALSSFSFVAQVRNRLHFIPIPEWYFLNQKSWRKSLLKAQQTIGLDAFTKKHPNNWSQAIYKFTPSCDQKECKNTTDPRVECSCQSNCFYVTSQVNQNLGLQS